MTKKTKRAIEIGAGIAGVAAAAAGAYFLTSTKKGKKVSKKAIAWAGKAQKEVVAEMKKIEAINQKAYNKAVDEVAKRYKAVKNVDVKDVVDFSKELKGHWNGIKKEIESKLKPKIAVKKKAVAKKKPIRKK